MFSLSQVQWHLRPDSRSSRPKSRWRRTDTAERETAFRLTHDLFYLLLKGRTFGKPNEQGSGCCEAMFCGSWDEKRTDASTGFRQTRPTCKAGSSVCYWLLHFSRTWRNCRVSHFAAEKVEYFAVLLAVAGWDTLISERGVFKMRSHPPSSGCVGRLLFWNVLNPLLFFLVWVESASF